MTELSIYSASEPTLSTGYSFPLSRRLRYWTAVLIMSLAAALAAALAGVVIGIFSLFGLLSAEKGIVSLATVLLLGSFPLFTLAAHSLDALDRIDKEARRQGISEKEVGI